MKKIIKKALQHKYIILIFIMLLGFLLRSHNLNTWPRLGATFDEYAWTWLGISLIQDQYPQSWSPHMQYRERMEIRYQDTAFMLVKPYLEHPPIFGLVAGSYALANGVNDMFDVTIDDIRGLAIILGILSLVFLYLLVSELYGVSIGLIATGLYALVPTVVVGSRLVQNENFFIPFFLLSLWLLKKYLQKKRKIFFYLCAVICGLLLLAKIPWIAATGAIVLILFFNKRFKDAVLFTGVVAFFFIAYLLYGMTLDSELFISLWQLQLNRYDLAFNSVFALFTEPFLADRHYIDGWIYFGWFAFIVLLTKDLRKNTFIVFPLLAYFLVFVAAIPNEPGHGWYRYPFYPFLVISIALFLKEHFNKNYLLTFFFFIFTGLSMLQHSWAQSFGFSYVVFRIFLAIYGVSLLPLFFPIRMVKKATSVINYCALVGISLLSIWAILLYNEQ